MAIALRNTSFGGGSNGTATVTKPSGTASGDVLLANIYTDNSETISLPSGWTQLDTTLISVGGSFGGSNFRHTTAYKLAGGSEPTSYAFTPSGGGYTEAQVSAFSGCDGTTPIDAHNAPAGTAHNLTIASITTSAAGCMVVACCLGWDGGGFTTPSGWTSIGTGGSNFDYGSFYKLFASAGATGTVSITNSNGGSENSSGCLISLLPAGGGGSTVSGSATMTANAALAESAALVSNPATPVQANVALAASASIVETTANTANVQANAALVAPARVTANGIAAQANSALVETTAQVLAPTAVQVNAALAEGTVVLIETTANPAAVAANAALAQSAQVLAASVAQVQASASLAQSAQVVESSTIGVQANAALSVTGGLAGQGGGTIIANAALALDTARVNAPASVQANVALVASAGILVSGGIPTQANASLAATGRIQASAAVQANAALSIVGTVVVAVALQANAALATTGGLAGQGGGTVVANAALVQTAARLLGSATEQTNAVLLASAGQVLAAPTAQTNAVLIEAAQIAARAFATANAGLVATGVVVTPGAVHGSSLDLSNAATATATITHAPTAVVTLSDALLTT
jgi:hypothetical protein